MAGAGDSLVKQYPPATHQFLEVPLKAAGNGIKGFRDDIWRARALLLIADHQYKNGQLSSARENLQLAARGIRTNVPLRDNGETFHTLVKRHAEIGDLAGAIAQHCETGSR